MSKFKFEPKDFENHHYASDQRPCEAFAEMCNTKLDVWLSEAKVVYSCLDVPDYMNAVWGVEGEGDTHRALLVNIEDLPKEPCKHEPDLLKMFKETGIQNSQCKHCGVKLEATWSEVK